MPAVEEPSRLNILHVLTLNGRNGEYGGPVRVAKELCKELNSRGHKTHIFSGALLGSKPETDSALSESHVCVEPILKKFKVSSLWSWKLISPLNKLVKASDVIHIHFARDLIPFLAAFLSVINRKPFVTQTHGMLVFDGRLSTRIVDLLITRPLINKSKMNLVLTDYENIAVEKMGFKTPLHTLSNGIAIPEWKSQPHHGLKRVVFCSRLDKRKGVDRFIDLAEAFKYSKMKFEIYGPDGGELEFVKLEIEKRNLSNIAEYKGSLAGSEVQNMLQEVDLLVLPSKDEPFPMIVLEALAVGTQVLVMPSCGISRILKKFNTHFVSESEQTSDFIKAFEAIIGSNLDEEIRIKIRDFACQEFSITKVVDLLETEYWDIGIIRKQNSCILGTSP